MVPKSSDLEGAGGDRTRPSLQALLEADNGRDPAQPHDALGGPSISDPVALFGHLEASLRFHRDTGFGRVFHPGQVSFRENRPTNSLHVVIQANHISAHVDRVSPLGEGSQGRPRYLVWRTAAHNLAGMAEHFIQILRGRQGDQRSELDCDWLWGPDRDDTAPDGLLDPRTSAWSIQLEAQVSRRLDDDRLARALTAVFGRLKFTHDPLRVSQCPDQASLAAERLRLQSQPAGMTDWPPLQATLAHHGGGDVLMLNINHAASDGVDALRLLVAIAQAYASRSTPDLPPDSPAVAPLPVRPATRRISKVRQRGFALVEKVRDLLAQPAQLASEEGGHEEGSDFHLVCLSADQTNRVVDRHRPDATRNALLAGLHLAIGQWNQLHGTPGRRIGVLVPVDLRPPEWPKETMGNFSVTARVSTSRRHRANAASALRAVTAQYLRNNRARTGVALLAGLERSGLLPLWAKQSLIVLQPVSGNRLVDTAVLSDLGSLAEPPSFGDDAGGTTHVWFSPPARTPRTLCVGAVTVSGRLHLVVRYPRCLFSAAAARRFTDGLLHEIAEVGAAGHSRCN